MMQIQNFENLFSTMMVLSNASYLVPHSEERQRDGSTSSPLAPSLVVRPLPEIHTKIQSQLVKTQKIKEYTGRGLDTEVLSLAKNGIGLGKRSMTSVLASIHQQ